MTIKLDADDKVTEVAFEGKGCAISTAATSLLTDELVGKIREELLRLPKEYVLELLGIEISATRMKCAMLGLKIVKSPASASPPNGRTRARPAARPKRRPTQPRSRRSGASTSERGFAPASPRSAASPRRRRRTGRRRPRSGRPGCRSGRLTLAAAAFAVSTAASASATAK